MKLDETKVHEFALALLNPRMTPEEQAAKVKLGSLNYMLDFRRRALTGGALTFLEAKALVREHMTWFRWRVTFYEVVQFPHVRFFTDKDEAMEFFKKATEERGGLRPQRMEVFRPQTEIFGPREVEIEWKVAGYKPDPLTFKYR